MYKKEARQYRIHPYIQRFAAIAAKWFMRICFSRVQFIYNDNLMLTSLPKNCPVIFVANHVTSVDNIIALRHTTFRFKRNFVLVASKRAIECYPLLRVIGAFSVSSDAYDNFRAFKTIKSISEKNIAVWYFPQGEFVPHDKLCTSTFSEGIVTFINQFRSCVVVPVGFYYYSFRKPQHAVSVFYSQPHVFTRGVDATTAYDLFDAVIACVNHAKDAALSSLNPHMAYPWQVQPHREDKIFAED